MTMVNSRQHMNEAIIVRSMPYFKSPVTVFGILNGPDKTNMKEIINFEGADE
jgi:hypothetical protein